MLNFVLIYDLLNVLFSFYSYLFLFINLKYSIVQYNPYLRHIFWDKFTLSLPENNTSIALMLTAYRSNSLSLFPNTMLAICTTLSSYSPSQSLTQHILSKHDHHHHHHQQIDMYLFHKSSGPAKCERATNNRPNTADVTKWP